MKQKILPPHTTSSPRFAWELIPERFSLAFPKDMAESSPPTLVQNTSHDKPKSSSGSRSDNLFSDSSPGPAVSNGTLTISSTYFSAVDGHGRLRWSQSRVMKIFYFERSFFRRDLFRFRCAGFQCSVFVKAPCQFERPGRNKDDAIRIYRGCVITDQRPPNTEHKEKTQRKQEQILTEKINPKTWNFHHSRYKV